MLLHILLAISSLVLMDSSYTEEAQGQRFADTDTVAATELEKAVHAVRELYYTGNGEKVSIEIRGNSSLEGLVGLLDEESMLVDREPSSLDFVRGLREEDAITDARFLEKNIAYIKINFFGRRTGADFKKNLDYLNKGGMSGLILDLRNNPGGVLQSALDVLSYFVPDGRLLITEVHKKGRKQHFSQDKARSALTEDLPIAVLINASTASSAEIVAATLRRYRDAAIVGQRSHAKGTIQEVIPLSAKKTLILTTGEYTLFDGSSLKDTGIVPDHPVDDKERQLETAISILTGR